MLRLQFDRFVIDSSCDKKPSFWNWYQLSGQMIHKHNKYQVVMSLMRKMNTVFTEDSFCELLELPALSLKKKGVFILLYYHMKLISQIKIQNFPVIDQIN